MLQTVREGATANAGTGLEYMIPVLCPVHGASCSTVVFACTSAMHVQAFNLTTRELSCQISARQFETGMLGHGWSLMTRIIVIQMPGVVPSTDWAWMENDGHLTEIKVKQAFCCINVHVMQSVAEGHHPWYEGSVAAPSSWI